MKILPDHDQRKITIEARQLTEGSRSNFQHRLRTCGPIFLELHIIYTALFSVF